MRGPQPESVFLLPPPPPTEPVPPPQILAKSVSVTADWCNVTLECRALGASEDLNVTWRLSGRPQKWQQTWTPEAGPSAGTLAVRLPLDQANISLTCIVCNKVDLKSAITTLGDICVHGEYKVPEGHTGYTGHRRFSAHPPHPQTTAPRRHLACAHGELQTAGASPICPIARVLHFLMNFTEGFPSGGLTV